MKFVCGLIVCLFVFPAGLYAKDDPVLKTFEKTVDIHCKVSSINSDDLGQVVDFLFYYSIIVLYKTHQPYFFNILTRQQA